MAALIQFLFIVVLPLVVIAGVLAGLFALGAIFDALDYPQELRTRIEAAFRRPPKPARTPGPGHYYRPHWNAH